MKFRSTDIHRCYNALLCTYSIVKPQKPVRVFTCSYNYIFIYIFGAHNHVPETQFLFYI